MAVARARPSSSRSSSIQVSRNAWASSTVPKAKGMRRASTLTSTKPAPSSSDVHSAGVGQRERTRGVAGRLVRVVLRRGLPEGVVDGGDPLVGRDLLPDGEGEASSRAKGSAEVGERCRGVTEEHASHAAHGHVEGRQVEGVHLGVALDELDVADGLALGGLPGDGQHRPREVQTEHRAVAGASGQRTRRRPGAATDVEDPVVRADVTGLEQSSVEDAEEALVLPVVRRPVLAVGTVPLAGLLGVGGIHRERDRSAPHQDGLELDEGTVGVPLPHPGDARSW